MAKPTRIEINPDGCAEALSQPSVVDYCLSVANRALQHARSNAPYLSGDYRDSLDAVVAKTGAEGELTGVKLISDDWKWHWVEYGSVNNQPHRTLTNAAQSVADRYEAL